MLQSLFIIGDTVSTGTSGHTNMESENNKPVCIYPDKEQYIKNVQVPEKLMDERFICQPVSTDESRIELKETTQDYGVDYVEFLDQIAFEDKEV